MPQAARAGSQLAAAAPRPSRPIPLVPLMTAAGAGAEMRAAIGTAVFFGMLGVTVFGLLFTPVFYVVIRRLTGTRESNEPAVERPAAAE